MYGVNTLGSIVGVSIAALMLMPLAGLKALLSIGALLDMAIGVVILFVAARFEPGSLERGASHFSPLPASESSLRWPR